MTRRAPPLARIAAVAAPRPDAEPVTIAHIPSFDIAFPHIDLEPHVVTASHHIVPANACKSAKLRRPELMPAAGAACGACRRPCGHRRLSGRWLFLIIGC